MAKCWTCGAPISGVSFTCPSCKSLSKLEDLRRQAESYREDISESINYMAEVQRDGFIAIDNTFSTGFAQIGEGLSQIASAIEWGFDDIGWKLQQQTDVLLSIDSTLKTPSQTKANELRRIAEELRRRETLNEAEEFFLKALELNPLDYRIYVGLAKTYLQNNKFDKAKEFLEKSLPHAPNKKDFDYKSYSYRLIGHIYECKEDYSNAMVSLHTSIELSPTYEDGHYDYAQYCAQMGNTELCLSSLEKAIFAKSLYWYLAQKEQNFNPVRNEVEKLTKIISTETCHQAEAATDKAENTLKDVKKTIERRMGKAWEAVSNAEEALDKSRDSGTLNSSEGYNNARTQYHLTYKKTKSTLESARDKVASGDYTAFLEAKPIADKSIKLAIKVRKEMEEAIEQCISKANEEREYYNEKRAEKVKNAWRRVPGSLIGWPLLSGIIGAMGGCTVGLFTGDSSRGADIGFFLGVISGFIFGIYNISKELS